MGDPKYSRRIWKKPKRPLNYDLKMDELKLLGTFGLKTKRELWKARTELSRVRKQARSLLALRKEIREEKEPIFMKSLIKIKLVDSESTLDNVLNLQITDLLERRLQTIAHKKLEFTTAYQARQAITHCHVMIDDRIIDVPSYIVKRDEEDKIHFASGSNLQKNIGKMKTKRKVEPPSEEGDTPYVSVPAKSAQVATGVRPTTKTDAKMVEKKDTTIVSKKEDGARESKKEDMNEKSKKEDMNEKSKKEDMNEKSKKEDGARESKKEDMNESSKKED